MHSWTTCLRFCCTKPYAWNLIWYFRRKNQPRLVARPSRYRSRKGHSICENHPERAFYDGLHRTNELKMLKTHAGCTTAAALNGVFSPDATTATFPPIGLNEKTVIFIYVVGYEHSPQHMPYTPSFWIPSDLKACPNEMSFLVFSEGLAIEPKNFWSSSLSSWVLGGNLSIG